MWTLPSCARRVIRAGSLLAPESWRQYPARTSLVSPLHTGVVSRHARATLKVAWHICRTLWGSWKELTLGARQNKVNAHIVLPGTHHSTRCMRLKSWHQLKHNGQFMYNYVLFVQVSYQARFCLQISYPATLFTMLMGFFNRGSFIIHIRLPGTSKAFTFSVFLPGARVHIVLPAAQR